MAWRVLPRKAWRNWRRADDLRIPWRSTAPEDADRRFLLYGLLPLWVVPGLADWWMHRRTHIERAGGTKESAVHALMMKHPRPLLDDQEAVGARVGTLTASRSRVGT